jgi:hypothetical protein
MTARGGASPRAEAQAAGPVGIPARRTDRAQPRASEQRAPPRVTPPKPSSPLPSDGRGAGVRARPTPPAPLTRPPSSAICHLPSAICHLPFAICYLPFAISYRPSPIGHRLSAIGYRPSAIGYRLSAIAYRLSAIAYRLSAIAVPVRSVRRPRPRPFAPRSTEPSLPAEAPALAPGPPAPCQGRHSHQVPEQRFTPRPGHLRGTLAARGLRLAPARASFPPPQALTPRPALFQANGLTHTSPGQRSAATAALGNRPPGNMPSAESAIHGAFGKGRRGIHRPCPAPGRVKE